MFWSTSAGVVSDLPLFGGSSTAWKSTGGPLPCRGTKAAHGLSRHIPIISPPWDAARERARFLSRSTTEEAPGVVIINETLAMRFVTGEEPVGRRLGLSGNPRDGRDRGVVGDIATYDCDVDVNRGLRSFLQNAPGYLSGMASAMNVMVRSPTDPSSLAPALREQVMRLIRINRFPAIRTMEGIWRIRCGAARFNMVLRGVRRLALFLAAVGIYGVIAYTVRRKGPTKWGIPLARARAVGSTLSIFAHSMFTTGCWHRLGLGAAFGLTRLLQNLLYQVTATDPFVFASIPVLLLLVAMLATYIPARRAMKVDPITALREP